MPYFFLQPLCLIGIIDVMRHYVKAFFLIFYFLFCLFAFRLFIFVKNGIIILIFNLLPLFNRKEALYEQNTKAWQRLDHFFPETNAFRISVLSSLRAR